MMKMNILAVLLVYLCASANAGPAPNHECNQAKDVRSVQTVSTNPNDEYTTTSTNGGPPTNPDGTINGQGTVQTVLSNTGVAVTILGQINLCVQDILNGVSEISVNGKPDVLLQYINTIIVKVQTIIGIYKNYCNKMQPSEYPEFFEILQVSVSACSTVLQKFKGVYAAVNVQIRYLLQLYGVVELFMTLSTKLIAVVSVEAQAKLTGLVSLCARLGTSVFDGVLYLFASIGLSVQALQQSVTIDVVVQSFFKVFGSVQSSVNTMVQIIVSVSGSIEGINNNMSTAIQQCGNAVRVFLRLIISLVGYTSINIADGTSIFELDVTLNKILVSIQALVFDNVKLTGVVNIMFTIYLQVLIQLSTCYRTIATLSKGTFGAFIGISVYLVGKVKFVVSFAARVGINVATGLGGLVQYE